MARGVSALFLFFSVVTCGAPAHGLSWVAGGWASGSWSGGWPTLTARGRIAPEIFEGHEVGLSVGIATERLHSQVLYVTDYTRCFRQGRLWPVVALWVGGISDVIGAVIQSRMMVGGSVGVRVPLGARSVFRFDVGHERYAGQTWFDRTFFAIGFEIIGRGSQNAHGATTD